MKISLKWIALSSAVVAALAVTFFALSTPSVQDEIASQVSESFADYSQQVENTDVINLTGSSVMLINDTHYVQRNKIFLHDDSKLIIRDSLFEHQHDYSFQHILEAYDSAQVIVNNSEIKSSEWLNWNFYGDSSLTFNNVEQRRSFIWHWFPDRAKAFAYNSRLRATIDHNASFYIENGTGVFIELALNSPSIFVDESLPKKVGHYTFPNEDEVGVTINLTMKNTETVGWGITAVPTSDVTYRDVDGIVVTWSFGHPWEGRTIVLEDLKSGYYRDRTWDLGEGTRIRLVNTTVNKWSPIVGNGNTMIIRRSDLADNAFNWGDGKVVIEDSTLEFVRARNDVQISLVNSEVSGDVVVQDNGIITLNGTKVGGSIVEEDSGKVIVVSESSGEVQPVSTGVVTWNYDRDEFRWWASEKPPACPEPLVLQAPVDLDLVTSILYPGQMRGGDFKPHGGFRTDGTDGPVEVTAPLEGYVWRVAKFNDSAGIHYMFDIQHPCGIMYRLGHLSAVPPKLEKIFDGFPQRDFGDSRTEQVEPVFIGLGEVIVTDTQEGTGFDWGVYDLRRENDAASDPAFREAHEDEAEQAFHALCWLDYLPADQQAIVKSLPGADGVSGKNSDYC
jgi:hypothetical protein